LQRGWGKDIRGRITFLYNLNLGKDARNILFCRDSVKNVQIEIGALWVKLFFAHCREACFWLV